MRQRHSIFYWPLTAIILWAFGALSMLMAITSASMAIQAEQGSTDVIGAARIVEHVSPSHVAQLFLHGVVANVAIFGLCIFGWHLMRRRTRHSLQLGALVVMLALFITMFRWLCEYVSLGVTPGWWIEPIFIWLPFAYTIMYAYQKSKEPPPNEADATR